MTRRKVIGIFSREPEERYRWLTDFLLTLRGVRDVRPVQIAKDGYREFRTELSKCTFAILYHSKKRGHLNITDVTDALYDEELKALSNRLGRDNVMVVVDGLDDISEEQKIKILKNQPSIWTHSRDVLLFGSDVARNQKEKNLRQIKDIIEEYAFPKYFIWAVFAAFIVLLTLILVLSLRSGHEPGMITELTTDVTTIYSTTGTITNMTMERTTDMTMNMTTNMTMEMTTDMTMNMTTNMTMEMTTDTTMNMTANMTMEMTTDMTMNMTANMTMEMTTDMALNMTTNTTVEMIINTTKEMSTDLPTHFTKNVTMDTTTEMPTTITSITTADISRAMDMATNVVHSTTEETITMYHPRSTKLTPTHTPNVIPQTSSHGP
uniref:Uncharacterized protein n=1 Tax=Leptobrachium leishanense TaxID=445787 RepID=A0A8C5WFK1_9ANUR